MISAKVYKSSSVVAGLSVLLALGGCVMETPTYRTRAPVTPTGIEGNWRNSEGLYTARFANQAFQWNDINSGAVLVSGTYNKIGSSDYRLVLNSAQSGQTKQANCRLSGNSVLNCTRDDGQNFQMYRS